MRASFNRRDFIKGLSLTTGGVALGGLPSFAADGGGESPFKVSLAEWSLHTGLKAGEIDHMNFSKMAKEDFGISAVEYVNQFFMDKVKDMAYLGEMEQRAADLGVTNVLIMCDNVGNLGNPDDAKRTEAVEGHYAWVDAAKFLGCHSIRVNARSDDKLSNDEQKKLCVDGLGRLSAFAKDKGIGVIVENHGGLSSNGAWLAAVMTEVGMDNCGTLPDFGNFYVAKSAWGEKRYNAALERFGDDPAYTKSETGLEFDRYKGIELLMPFAKGVSAKSHDFNEAGDEIHTDYRKAMQIVKDSGYTGYVGIEYEGKELSEPDGVKATKALLDKVFAELS